MGAEKFKDSDVKPAEEFKKAGIHEEVKKALPVATLIKPREFANSQRRQKEEIAGKVADSFVYLYNLLERKGQIPADSEFRKMEGQA